MMATATAAMLMADSPLAASDEMAGMHAPRMGLLGVFVLFGAWLFAHMFLFVRARLAARRAHLVGIACCVLNSVVMFLAMR
jgi:hypothetical protein